MESEFIVREYKTKDARDLLENDYPFDDTNEFGSWYKDTKLKIVSFLDGRYRKRFVVYSLKEKKIVGSNKVDSITKNLWHGGAIFIIPSHRGRGISGLLVTNCDNYQRKFGVSKRVGNIELTNIPSLHMAIKRGFISLSQTYYQCDGSLTDNICKVEEDEKIKLVSSHGPKGSLFKVYQKCVNHDWRDILEIDEDNFLERFFGYITMQGLFKLWFRNKIVAIKEGDAITGYFHYAARLLPIRKKRVARVYLYTLPSSYPKNIVGHVLRFLRKAGYDKASVIFTNKDHVYMEKMAIVLQDDYNFKKREFLINYSNIK